MKQKTILIIEDEKPLSSLLSGVLQKKNFSVLVASDGKIGITTALQSHPDLILLDLLMPVMNGMEVLKKIRNDVWGANVPIIVLTNLSADSEELMKDMVEGHPICYLIKSDWKIEDVVKKVNDALKI